MVVLGIESSCDDTALALVKDNKTVISELVFSQFSHHQDYGGVVPELASRLHLQRLANCFEKLMIKARASDKNFSPQDIDVISVCQGPGLVGSLLVGCEYAKGLSLALSKPIITVDHVKAHLHAAFFQRDSLCFPSLGFVVSGGHTHLFRLESKCDITLIAHSLDDACGECFDKVAKMLGCKIASGAEIEKIALTGDPNKYPMPIMANNVNQDFFSYSGLKTHVKRLITGLKLDSEYTKNNQRFETVADLCASFQKEAIGQLIRKLEGYLTRHSWPQAIYLGGGVVCNGYFRSQLDKISYEQSIKIFYPVKKLCCDNAVMIASLGYAIYNDTTSPTKHNYQFEPYPISKFKTKR